jgi:hypothetical protein
MHEKTEIETDEPLPELINLDSEPLTRENMTVAMAIIRRIFDRRLHLSQPRPPKTPRNIQTT